MARYGTNRWSMNIPAASLRDAIENSDLEGVRTNIKDVYSKMFNQGIIDDYDYQSWTEELDDMELSEDAIDYQLDQMYDACDNLGVWLDQLR